jgi:hypothetical protein
MRKILLALALTAALLAGSAGMASAAPAAASKADPVPVLYNLGGVLERSWVPGWFYDKVPEVSFDPLGNSRLPLPGPDL